MLSTLKPHFAIFAKKDEQPWKEEMDMKLDEHYMVPVKTGPKQIFDIALISSCHFGKAF